MTAWALVAKTNGGVTTYTDVGLEPATTYWYRVSAITTSGAAVASDIVSATTSVAPPEAPSVLAVATSTTVDLSWADGASETAYRIERSMEDSIGWIRDRHDGHGRHRLHGFGAAPGDHLPVPGRRDERRRRFSAVRRRLGDHPGGEDRPGDRAGPIAGYRQRRRPKDGRRRRLPIEGGAAAIVEDGAAAIDGGVATLEAKAEYGVATVEDAAAVIDQGSAAVLTG